MKILKLSQKKKKKLLSLCEEFFPTNFEHKFSIVDDDVLQIFVPSKSSKGSCEGEHLIRIHWYQLCLTELSTRMIKKLNKEGRFQFYEGFGIETDLSLENLVTSHPVDLLYDFVKECKKNKYFKK